MKRLLLFIILTAGITGHLAAQASWYERYRECINDSSLEYTRQVIEQWEQAEPESADVYAAWFNYYYKMSRDEVMAGKLWNLKTARVHQYTCMRYRCLTIHF